MILTVNSNYLEELWLQRVNILNSTKKSLLSKYYVNLYHTGIGDLNLYYKAVG
jgi:hypothetical protein